MRISDWSSDVCSSDLAKLGADQWFDAAHGIMTTDTLPKIHSRRVQIDGKTVTFTGISKGAGMIRPNMATMLRSEERRVGKECQYVWISVVAVSLKKKQKKEQKITKTKTCTLYM